MKQIIILYIMLPFLTKDPNNHMLASKKAILKKFNIFINNINILKDNFQILS